MPDITIDQPTFEAVDLAARLTGMTHGQVITRLVQQSKLPDDPSPPVGNDRQVEIYADYNGHRTRAMFDRLTHRIDILGEGALGAQSFKSPSSAARAVVEFYRPGVSPHRNGWSFWMLADGSKRYLQSIRHD